jgi:hypothetical protein
LGIPSTPNCGSVVAMHAPPFKPFHKKARRGFKGHPVATLMFCGPDDKVATKVSVGINLEPLLVGQRSLDGQGSALTGPAATGRKRW